MRAILLAFVLSLSAATVYAIDACTLPSPSNTIIVFGALHSHCAQNNLLVCGPNDPMLFGAVANGYSFGCESHTFTWDFGDGIPGSGFDVFHTYTAPGTYVVKLTLTSGLSPTVVLTQTVNVFVPVPAIDPRMLIVLALAFVAIAFLRLR